MTAGAEHARSPGHLRRTWTRFRRDPVAMTALVVLGVVGVAGLLHGWIAPYDPHELQVGEPLSGPSWDHLLGTDNLGRDTLSRILEGAFVSMRFSVLAVGGALAIAVPLGMLSGYVGGMTDTVLMRIADAIMSIPGLVLAIALVAVLGTDLTSAMIAIGAAMTPGFTRLVRGQALAIREETFIEASTAIGTPTVQVLSRHIFPNVLSPLVVQASIVLGVVLLAEASLSFLGLGAQPPTASWGAMLQDANDYLLTESWQVVPPGMAIALSVLAFNLVGDGLRGALGTGNQVRRYGRLGLTTVEPVSPPPASAVPRQENPVASPSGDAGPAPLLEVRDLQVDFQTDRGSVRIVDRVSLSVAAGETLGLVGESGSGKTVTSLALMRLLTSPPATITGGSVQFDGCDLLGLSFREMAARRGSEIAMIFQDPMASLNPSLTIAHQIGQVVRWHERVSRQEARRRALESLEHVGVSATRADSYPHEFSGGMRQRAMIAMALVCRPKLLIADEPTTALDVTIQAQVLELLHELRAELGMAMIFVTHDLGVVADICDRVAVMYAGEIVETAPVAEFFSTPRHPYAEGLLRAMPHRAERRSSLYVIPGQVPQFHELGEGCRLAGRCAYVADKCRTGRIALRDVGPDRRSRCVRADELELVSR